jgi:hypothetical protein
MKTSSSDRDRLVADRHCEYHRLRTRPPRDPRRVAPESPADLESARSGASGWLPMRESRGLRRGAFLTLALAMAATRFGHFGAVWVPPDASWAVFFLAGFYLSGERWVLPALLLEAIAIDFLAIHDYGVSDYCVTVAYWFIVPAYSFLWLGGVWLRRHYRHRPSDLLHLAGSLLISVTVCFLLTQGSFYWFGSRAADPSLIGWWSNFTDWYGHFLLVTCAYVAAVAVGHVAVVRPAPAHAGLRAR